MITRRRRQGSESEQQLVELEGQHQVLKGPSSALLWSGESNQQPSFFIVPPSELGSFVAPADSNTGRTFAKTSADAMALVANPSSSVVSSTNASSRDRTAEFLSAVRSFQSRSANGAIGRPNNAQLPKNTDQHQQYSEFMKVAKYVSSSSI